VIIFEMTKKEFHIILSYKRQFDWGERDSCIMEKVSYFPQMHLWFAFYPDSGARKGGVSLEKQQIWPICG